MIEHYFVQPKVLRRLRAGLISPHLNTLAAELQTQHYSRKSIRRQLRNADAFGRWLAEQKIPWSEVTDAVVARYVEPMHRCPGPSRARGYRPHNARGLPHLMELLRRQAVVPTEPVAEAAPPSAGELWLQAFDQHLERVVGNAASTRLKYLRIARAFLQATCGEGEPNWAQLRAEHVAAFVQKRAETRALTCRKDPGQSLRIFLRFLSGASLIPAGLQYAVPPVRQYKHAALPRFLTTEDLARVLALPPDPTSRGLRDRAMLLLLARLGLRPGEIVRLELEDIHWRAGDLLVRAGKTRRERVLPLPQDVGEALLSYLKEGRPASSHRRVFLNLCPPHGPLASSVVLTKVARLVLARAGVLAPPPGAYVFRHTVATQMVCRGVTFKEVADVLGHQSLNSTGIYAKLNLPSLAQVALPWPGGAQ